MQEKSLSEKCWQDLDLDTESAPDPHLKKCRIRIHTMDHDPPYSKLPFQCLDLKTVELC